MKKLELVVLLRGNFVVIASSEEYKDTLTKLLHECCNKANNDPNLFLKWDDMTILAKEIIGWYFRAPVVSHSEQIIKFMDKKLPNANDGDDWKNGN